MCVCICIAVKCKLSMRGACEGVRRVLGLEVRLKKLKFREFRNRSQRLKFKNRSLIVEIKV